MRISQLIENLSRFEDHFGDIDVVILDQEGPRSSGHFKLTVGGSRTNEYTAAPVPTSQYGGEAEGISLFLHNKFGIPSTRREDFKDFDED